MKQVLPIIIFCCVGIAFCVGYLIYLLISCISKSKSSKKVETMEFEENCLTIHLGRKNKDKNK